MEIIETIVGTDGNHFANGFGNLSLLLQSVFQSFNSGIPLQFSRGLLFNTIKHYQLHFHNNNKTKTHIDFDEVGDLTLTASQLATHQQVLDQLLAVLTLFRSGLEEELRETGTVDGVLGEMRAHCQINHRCIDFGLDLSLRLRYTTILHVTPFLWNVSFGLVAWMMVVRNGLVVGKAKIKWEFFIMQ